MPYALAGDLDMYYEEHGQADGPPLVLLHGFNSAGATWQPYLDTFGARYRLLVPDLRGHAHTLNPGGRAAMNHRQFARDVIAFCRVLGVGRAAFCGASTGAMLLLTLALEAPDLPAALVLSGGTDHFPAAARTFIMGLTPEAFIQLIPDPAAFRARHAPQGSEGWRTVTAAFSALGAHAHGDDFPAREELRGITTPTLIVHGDRDPLFPVAIATGLYEILPDAELCILPNSGHTPDDDRPEWFASITLDFLQRRAGYAPPEESAEAKSSGRP